MLKGLEYHGRLARRDGRPANPGVYDLQFALHPDPKSRRVLWSEDHNGVDVSPGGFFYVVLGIHNPMDAEPFAEAPLYLSTRIRRRGELAEELSYRVPMTALPLQMLSTLESLEQRIAAIEESRQISEELPHTSRLAERVSTLEKLVTLQTANDLSALLQRVEALAARVAELDGEDGRVDRLEDRLEDIDGEDGDVLDLHERVEDLEKMFASKRERR